MHVMDIAQVKKLFARLHKLAAEQKSYLVELDGKMGDGDLGLTMEAAFRAADEFARQYEGDDAGELLMKAGMTMAKAAPSTMGTLMATGFMRGGKSVKSSSQLGVKEMSLFWNAFVEGIMERGKSRPGEKTIVDTLHPAALAYADALEQGITLEEASQRAKQAAQEGLERTKDMIAQHGRAAYYQEKSKGVQDPGATMGALLIGEVADFIAGA